MIFSPELAETARICVPRRPEQPRARHRYSAKDRGSTDKALLPPALQDTKKGLPKQALLAGNTALQTTLLRRR